MRYMVISLTLYFSASFLIVICLFFFVGYFRRAFLLVTDHLFEVGPFQIFCGIVELVVIQVDHVFVPRGRFRQIKSCYLPMDIQGTVISWPVKIEGLVTCGET